MGDRRFIPIAAAALLFILTAVVVVALLGQTGSLGTILAAGTLSSLAATMLASGVIFVTGIRTVRSSPPADTSYLQGLRAVRPKNALTSEEWLQFLRAARTEFYVAGHSLGKWCSPSNRDDFKSHLKRILGNRGRVTLVMLDPVSPQIDRLQRATFIDYTGRIGTSLEVLTELCADLDPDSRSRLRVSVLKDHPALSYMVVGNERRLVTATYLGSTDTDDVACLELDRSSDAATAVYDDFHELARAGSDATLPGATISTSPPEGRTSRAWRRLLGR